ncbi:hypothetical protein RvY_10266 [Ramazzottius varieornatus]|uniref:Uncharacterized protein n=1 Tax=Ramazzottius varieornatus TaxID=947166 RepID=A0A1D1VC77_RAMVA|nr:hypothetical protein RvY_10266 [Ramazzottius varieornatus]
MQDCAASTRSTKGKDHFQRKLNMNLHKGKEGRKKERRLVFRLNYPHKSSAAVVLPITPMVSGQSTNPALDCILLPETVSLARKSIAILGVSVKGSSWFQR